MKRIKYDLEQLKKTANEIIQRDGLKTSAAKISSMTENELYNFIAKHGHENLPDELNPAFIFEQTDTELLCAAFAGEISLLELAKRALTSRGLDENGNYIGFLK